MGWKAFRKTWRWTVYTSSFVFKRPTNKRSKEKCVCMAYKSLYALEIYSVIEKKAWPHQFKIASCLSLHMWPCKDDFIGWWKDMVDL